MSGAHSHGAVSSANERALRVALALTGTFMIAEVIGGVLTGSLALISDAAHMLTDVTALAIALLAIRIGRRRADARRTFGYQRFEILAAAFNAGMLVAVAAYVLYEAYQRFRAPVEVHSSAMLVIAALGLAINLLSMRLLRQGEASSLNVKGAYLEVWSDMLGSLGVIAGALIIRFTGWTWVDPIIAVAIGLWVLPRTWVLLKASINILLEGVPEGTDLKAVAQTIRDTPGVLDLHELHVWSITTGRPSLTAHLSIDSASASATIIRAVSERLAEAHHITHTTLQCEVGPCPNPADDFHCQTTTASMGSQVPHSSTSHEVQGKNGI